MYYKSDAAEKPQKVTLEHLPGGKIFVRLADNIQPYKQEDQPDRTMYRFDEVQFFMPDGKAAAAQEIEEDFAKWWQYGMDDTHPDPDPPAPEEDDMIADSAINSGQFFMVGNTLYRALTAIASGATITVGTNAERVSLSDALNLVNT